jgi:hypothetical protein
VAYLSLCNICVDVSCGYSSSLIDFELLILNLVCDYVLDYPCVSYVGVLAVGHPIDLWYLWSRYLI